ncbi:MAG: DUF2065 family protein [Rhodobacteraceae bacterium]|nr:DUF2065 family protein [Paracoccaceae bacterium]MCF8513763.1 DUF2065 family protein [Paracoccaceae bacterium]MCF8518008.1 DUF2065 family protein [Paracoccaceae bacterium]
MTPILSALGLVLVLEGLALALAPSRIEDLLAFFARLSRDQRRMMGLAAVAIGVVLVAIARLFGQAG